MSKYDPRKLPEERDQFMTKRILVVGSGAVGTHIGDQIARMGASADFLDFDFFTADNAVKHCSIVRTPEDINRNKAECLSERLKPLLEEGCSANGINADLTLLGPEALSDYDYVVSAVDNDPAVVLLNRLWKSMSMDRRPLVIKSGTYMESAQSTILDGSGCCLECLLDENWLNDPDLKMSCTGPQMRTKDSFTRIIRTSGKASAMAAHLSTEQIRGHVLGYQDIVNRRLTYTAYPNLGLNYEKPIRRSSCPGCAVHPPSEIRWLDGCSLEMTLDEFLELVAEDLNTNDFEVAVHRLDYKNVSHGAFTVSSVCHHCGKPISVLKHEGRFFLEDLLCETCRVRGYTARYDAEFLSGEEIHAFTNQTPANIKAMTLFDLGYPLGAHVTVVERNGALDMLDATRIKTRVYSLRDDPKRMHTVKKLGD